jgi:hypothetical protein
MMRSAGAKRLLAKVHGRARNPVGLPLLRRPPLRAHARHSQAGLPSKQRDSRPASPRQQNLYYDCARAIEGGGNDAG